MEKIILAGGCFWGVQAYFDQLKGILSTSVGYIDGNMRHPTYEIVCSEVSGHAEACEIVYDETIITLEAILEHFLRFVNPFSTNRQGNDFGRQYRSGIYYESEAEKNRVISYLKTTFKDDYDRVRIQVKEAKDYDLAEERHQKYLEKNPYGYCHVDLNLAKASERK